VLDLQNISTSGQTTIGHKFSILGYKSSIWLKSLPLIPHHSQQLLTITSLPEGITPSREQYSQVKKAPVCFCLKDDIRVFSHGAQAAVFPLMSNRASHFSLHKSPIQRRICEKPQNRCCDLQLE